MSFARAPIPVSIVTGFLGAGKTTLINALLKDPDLKDAAVIVNEFGDVAIDHLLVERSGDGIIELSDGCLCCTVRGELVDTLADLADRLQTGRIARLSRVVVETTGLADPAPVLQAVMGHPVLLEIYRLDGVITLVDAVNGMATLDAHEEAIKQVAVADRLVLTKGACVDAAARRTLADRLRALNPGAPLIDADDALPRASGVLECGLYDPATKSADVARWLRDEAYLQASEHGHHGHRHEHDVNRHDKRIRAFTLTHDRPIDPLALEMFVDLIRSAHAGNMLRMKGIVQLSDDPDRPVVIHGVQSMFHPPARLKGWADDGDRRTRLVLITKDIAPDFVQRLFDAFVGKVSVDTPDRAALLDNPLAIPGGGRL